MATLRAGVVRDAVDFDDKRVPDQDVDPPDRVQRYLGADIETQMSKAPTEK
ncbi:hypothetical protein [uncultured Microbacterium sp.]|uniref:hypothetical protein n=1 Tax=uncultured Microbacterium sp. TaxID=191216 RepID=UPI0028D1A02E|nr:hypothetical protein [uncultured Microbacterium sp.]